MPYELPATVDTTAEGETLYQGFSRQDLKFHQALGELVDNSISSSPDLYRFKIEIHLQKNGDNVDLTVADNGRGISFEDLQKRVLRIGGKGSFQGPMNEHGFGLKNALCVLTQNQAPFHIITRDQNAGDENTFLKVVGPFRTQPAMEIIAGREAEWANDIAYCTGETGTRVYAQSTMQYFRSIFRGQAKFATLVERLLEHLGVMYRGYLEGKKSEIWIRWRDITQQQASWLDWEVVPIPVPYSRAQEETIDVTYSGQTYSVRYKWGTLDAEQAKDSTRGKPYPLVIYYQNNEKTQGIDIKVRGRVILPHVINYLWPDRERHPSLNSFTGELQVDDRIFSTVNNKIELDPNNPVWEAVSAKLQDQTKYWPSETIKESKRTERELRKTLLSRLKNTVYGSSVEENVPTWPAVGVEIDLVHRMPNGDEQIYELKAGTACPIDVYQLIMYWDAKVQEGTRPKLGRLVAKEGVQSVNTLIEYWNQRKDKGGETYKLEFIKIDQLV